MKYTFKFYPSVDSPLVRQIVFGFVAQLEHAVSDPSESTSTSDPYLTAGSEENICLRMANERAQRISVSVYQGVGLNDVLIDVHFNRTGQGPSFASLNALYEAVSSGVVEIRQFKHPWH